MVVRAAWQGRARQTVPPGPRFARLQAELVGAAQHLGHADGVGAQLVPHRQVDMRGSNSDEAIDFLAFSGHKLYAPYGAGVLIAPRELEDAILGLGNVEEACVFPIPDSEIGNRIGAALVLRAGADGAPTDKAMLAAALSSRIAPFKLPHRVVVLSQLPKNANGKTQRSQVAHIALAR